MKKDVLEALNYHIDNSMLVKAERKGFSDERRTGFPIKYSEQLLCMTDINDFHDEGFVILRNEDITDVYSNESDAFYEKICINEGLREKIRECPVNSIDNMEVVFKQLETYNGLVGVSCEKEIENYTFYLGKIKSVYSDKVEISAVGVDGEWDEETYFVNFEDITLISIADHYSKLFYKYLETEN